MNWIKNIFNFNEKNLSTNYGYGFEAKELLNNKWVLMYKNEGCDLISYGHTWEPGDSFFKDCMGSRKEIDKKAKDIMSMLGCLK